ncbi:MAG: hypothetical protein PVJ76_07775 [Gemmatimonadota bacterium]|jgi:hypothetical protein
MCTRQVVLVLVAGLLSPVCLSPQTPDTVKINSQVAGRLVQYYDTYGRFADFEPEALVQYLGWQCSGEGGGECMGGDWLRGACPRDIGCHPPRETLLEFLVETSREYPQSGFVSGQAVFALTRFGNYLGAMQVAEACQSAEWWCEGLRGYVLNRAGRVTESEPHLRSFVAGAPDSITCRIADGTYLLGKFSQRQHWRVAQPPQVWEEDWAEQPCEIRRAASDTIWWLADPLFILEGNDRWAEQISRGLEWIWSDEIYNAGRGSDWTGRLWEWRRACLTWRGPWDSWEYGPSSPTRGAWWYRLTSAEAARYHFVPDFGGPGFSHPTWRLLADLHDEGYSPAYGPFFEAQLQLARFRPSDPEKAGRMRVATATSVLGTPIEGAAESAYLILSDAPESFPLQLNAPFNEGRAVFLADAETKPYVTSLEILTETGIGWHREMLEPLAADVPGISDIILYRPFGLQPPDSLLAAASLMLGSTTFDLGNGSQLGLYWEVYGAPADSQVSFELELVSEGGLIGNLRRLLPGGPEEGSGRLGWTDPSRGLVFPKGIVLDIEDFDPGRYEVVLRATWEGQEEHAVRRGFVVR